MSRPADEKAFRFRRDESVRAAIRRIVEHEIDDVIEALSGPMHGETIHEVRKSTKRVRAVARLMRDELGARRYRIENRDFRDAARTFAPQRDADVLITSARRLADRFGSDGDLGVLRQLIRTARERLHASGRGNPHAMSKAQIVRSMRRARARAKDWPVGKHGRRVLASGLRRVYRQARAACRVAAHDPTVENLHEWRKRTKDLRYVLDLLEPVWPVVAHALAAEVDALADRLGEDHDLAMLRRFAVDHHGDGADLRPLLEIIDGARRDLQAASWVIATRVYEPKPRQFVQHLAAWWRAWKAEDSTADENAVVSAPSDERALASA